MANLVEDCVFQFLVLRRVRKIAKSDCLLRHVCLSIYMKQLGSQWTDFREIWYLSVFGKSVQKIQAWLMFDKNNAYFIRIYTFICDHISFSLLYNEKCFRRKL
jgi:hypothetical protein